MSKQLLHKDLEHRCKQINNLLEDAAYVDELKILRSSYRRIAVRLRTSRVTSQVKHVVASIRRFNDQNYGRLVVVYRENYARQSNQTISNNVNSKRYENDVDNLRTLLGTMMIDIDCILERSVFANSGLIHHLRVGHLAHHFLALSCTLARISVIFKALLVYTCDAHEILSEIEPKLSAGRTIEKEEKGPISPNAMLIKHGCKKRRQKQQNTVQDKPATSKFGEDFGTKIARPSMN